MTSAGCVIRPLPVDHEYFADLLNRKGIQCLTNLRDIAAACLTVIPENADFDQLVAAQMHVDFADHGRRQAGVADDHDGVEVVGASLQEATPLRSQYIHGASLTVCTAFSAGKGGRFNGA